MANEPVDNVSEKPVGKSRGGLTKKIHMNTDSIELLSMNRRNGLSQVLKQLKLYAAVFAAQDSAMATKQDVRGF